MEGATRKTWVMIGVGVAAVAVGGAIFLMSTNSKNKHHHLDLDDYGALVDRFELLPPPQPAPPAARHLLSNLNFAVDDIFDVEGRVTGLGNPDWLRTHDPASKTAVAVSLVVSQGAICIGKTLIDEFAFSITGKNKHYGTPINVAVASRVPGGSSSGSAVAVASKLVDFAVGFDVDGGVRVPAACCGVLAFRSSHGSVSCAGVVSVSQSYEAVGWFAKDADVLRRVGHVLLQLPLSDVRQARRILVCDDCFDLSRIHKEKSLGIVIQSFKNMKGRNVVSNINLEEYIASKVPVLKQFKGNKVRNGGESYSLDILSYALLLLKRFEFTINHSNWINMTKPVLGAGIAKDVREAMDISDEEIDLCLKLKNELRSALTCLLKNDGLLVLPTVPDVPPKLKSKHSRLTSFSSNCYSLLSIASISGCCQATVPVGEHDGCPLAVSFIGRYGADRFLLDAIVDLYPTLQEVAENALKVLPFMGNLKEAEAFKEKGNTAFKLKQWHKAVNHYSEAIKLNDLNAAYYCNRAQACLELGRFQQAEQDCSKAIIIDKKYVKAYFRRGTAREKLSSFKEALEDFKYALVLEPTNKAAASAIHRLQKLVF